MRRGEKTRHVLLHQGEAGQRALGWLRDQGGRLPSPGHHLVFVGSGTSYYLAQVAAFYAASTGRSAQAAPACEVLRFPQVYLAHRPQVVVVSRSGDTSEGVAAAQVARRHGCAVWAATCRQDGALSREADHVLWSPAGQDGTLVMLRSFTSMLLLLLAWLGRGQEDLGLDEVASALDNWAEQVLAELENHPEPPPGHLVVLGSGGYYGVAREVALKAEEMALVRPEVYHTLEYRHGPRACLSPGDLVLLLTEGSDPLERAVLDEARDLGARTWLFASTDTQKATGHRVWVSPQVGRGLARAVLAAVTGQVAAWYWAVSRGVDPDSPPHLTDVVAIAELSAQG
jgi:glucosamine--fructose-6-phosphate aminotransferase (isomerizing)